MISAKRQVYSWYLWSLAMNPWNSVAAPILSILLERFARNVGFWDPNLTQSCNEEITGRAVCKMNVLGIWVETSSFTLFSRSFGIITSMLLLLLLGPRLNHPSSRKLVYFISNLLAGLSSVFFGLIPLLSPHAQPFAAVLLTIIATNSFIVAFMCFTSYLPIIARSVHQAHLDDFQKLPPTESDPLLSKPIEQAIAVEAPSGLSLTIAKINSVCGVIDCVISVGSSLLLQVVLRRTSLTPLTCISITGAWWMVISTISTIGLPGSAEAARAVDDQPVDPKPMKKQSTFQLLRSLKRLPQMRKLLGAHIIACDLIMIVPGVLFLYASTRLGLEVSDISVMMMCAYAGAGVWMPCQTWVQAKLHRTNLQMLIAGIILALLAPLWGSLSLVSSNLGILNKWHCWILSVIFGVASAIYETYSRSLLSEMTPHGHETSFASLYMLSSRSTSFMGNLILGFILQVTGKYDYAWVFFGAISIITLPIFLSLRVNEGVSEALEYETEESNNISA